jgi:hypothetical protein
MLTNAQRDAITNPPDGLHLFNRDERCLNFYDSLYASWSCFCEVDTCKAILIHINTNSPVIDFYNTYAINYTWARKFSILIDAGVLVEGISFFNMPTNKVFKLKIVNKGNLAGSGGAGGRGASGQIGSCSVAAGNGVDGVSAIVTRTDLKILVDNYGIIAGGGGGGGGGGKTALGQYGGGGGGGAGSGGCIGGLGGGNTISGPFGSCGTSLSFAQNGVNGTLTNGGTGGTGASAGGNGGNAGGRAQAGTNGTGTAAGIAGVAGKAILSFGGSSASIINNIGGGQSFGVVE